MMAKMHAGTKWAVDALRGFACAAGAVAWYEIVGRMVPLSWGFFCLALWLVPALALAGIALEYLFRAAATGLDLSQDRWFAKH
jgi:hypothetical protein